MESFSKIRFSPLPGPVCKKDASRVGLGIFINYFSFKRLDDSRESSEGSSCRRMKDFAAGPGSKTILQIFPKFQNFEYLPIILTEKLKLYLGYRTSLFSTEKRLRPKIDVRILCSLEPLSMLLLSASTQTLFDVASCTEVEEPIGTLEVYCWS